LALYKNKRIDIILPWRIGDAILNIPMLVCLKQLNEKYNDNNNIRIIVQPFLSKLYAPLGIFECMPLTLGRKIISNLKPADIAFFPETINTNWGYKAKVTYGLTNNCKKIIKFHNEMLFMNLDKLREFLPAELISYLQDTCHLSLYSISLFGILLKLGYTTEQIIDTFKLSSDSLALNNFNGFSHPVMNEKYVVFCMEAAYGKKGDAFRRWDENNYIKIANKCYEDFGFKSVFVGVNQNFKLPDKLNFINLRKQINLFQLAQIIKSSVYYIGNDTAPLHIANIMQRPSIGIYFREESLSEFSPIFPELNTRIFSPLSPDDVYNIFKNLNIS